MAKKMRDMSDGEDDDDNISTTYTEDGDWGEDQEFEVESILAEMTTEDGERLFLIQWKDYDLLDSTWEPPENIQDDSILDDWRDRRMREVRKIAEPFDLGSFERQQQQRAEEKAERHRRRRIKRKRLGMSVSPSPPASDAEDSESSVEAMEIDEQPEDYPGIKRPSKRPMQRLSMFQTKMATNDDTTDRNGSHDAVASDLQRETKKKTGKVSSYARPRSQSSSDIPVSENVPLAELRKRQNLQELSSDVGLPQKRQKQPILASNETPSSTGYQGTARARPTGPRTESMMRRVTDEGLKLTTPLSVGHRGVASLRGAVGRGRGAIRGGSSASSRNVFAPRDTQMRKKKSLVEKIVDQGLGKAPEHFRTMRTRRKAELAGRAVQDAAPDISALPGGLFDPSKGFQSLRPSDVRKEPLPKATSWEDESHQQPTSTEVPIENSASKSMNVQQPPDPTFNDPYNMICWYWNNKGICSRVNDPLKPCKYLHSTPGEANVPIAPRPLFREEKSMQVCRYGSSCMAGYRCQYRHPERKNSRSSTDDASTERSGDVQKPQFLLPVVEDDRQNLNRGLGNTASRFLHAYQPNAQVCEAFDQGRGCMAGSNCRDFHPEKSQTYRGRIICRFWLEGKCSFPEAGCPYLHSHSPEPRQESYQTEDRAENISGRSLQMTSSAVARAKSVAFATEEPKQLYDEPESIPSLNSPPAPATSSQHSMEPHAPSARPQLRTHYSTTSILDQEAQIPTERRPSLPTLLPVPPPAMKRTTLEDYRLNKEFKEMNGVAKTVIFGSSQAQPITIKFIDLQFAAKYTQTHQSFNDIEKFKFDQMCIAEDFQFHQSSMMNQFCCQGSIGTDSLGHDTIDTVTEHLNANSCGLICPHGDFVILVYPARCEKWRFIEAFSSHSVEGQLRYLIFEPNMPIKVPRNKPHGTNLRGTNGNGKQYRTLLASKIHHMSLSTILPNPSKFKEPHFYLMFPKASKLSAEFISSFLQAKKWDSKFYSSESEGSWDYFVNAEASAKVVLFHESAITSISACRSILKLLLNRERPALFWCIDDSLSVQPEFSFLPSIEANIGRVRATQFFPPHGALGGAILLTPSFLVAEPEKTHEFLVWFRTAVMKVPFGTWKLVCCYNIRQYLLDLAIDKALELKQFKEDHRDDDAMDANALKKGLSYEKCKQRFEVHHEIVNLLSRGTFLARPDSGETTPNFTQSPSIDGDHLTDELATWCGIYEADEPDELFNHVIYAHRDIDADDEQGLATWFAAWSLRRLDVFRRFFIIGTGNEHANRAFRMKEVTPGMIMSESIDTASTMNKILGEKKPVSLGLQTPKPKVSSNLTSTVQQLNIDGACESVSRDASAINEMNRKGLSVAENLKASASVSAPNPPSSLSPSKRRREQEPAAQSSSSVLYTPVQKERSFQASTHLRPLPAEGMSPMSAGTVLVAAQDAPRKGLRIEIRSGDLVKIIKHVSGITYHGTNLNTDQTGHFPNNIFSGYLHHEDNSRIPAGTVLVAEENIAMTGNQVEVRSGELVKIDMHVEGIIYYGTNLNTDERGQFPSTIFAGYLVHGKRRAATTERGPTKRFNDEDVPRQLCAFFNEGQCRFRDACVRKHICSKCGSKHGAYMCSDRRNERRKPMQTHTESKRGIPRDILVNQICGWFNSPSNCDFGSHCIRRHICALCSERDHGVYRCPGVNDSDTQIDIDTRANHQIFKPDRRTSTHQIKPEDQYLQQYDGTDERPCGRDVQPEAIQRVPSGDQYLLQYDGADGRSLERDMQQFDGTMDDRPYKTSAAGIETSVTGQRPGYVPPEDKAVYKSPRTRKVLSGYETSSSSGPTKQSNGTRATSPPDSSLSRSPIAMLDYVATSLTPDSMSIDEPTDVGGTMHGDPERVNGPVDSNKKVSMQMEVTTEWYGKQKALGNVWEHIYIDRWEEAFKTIDSQLAAHAPNHA